jgi:hypothetical protein
MATEFLFVCLFWGSSLRVCNLSVQLLLGVANVVTLRSKSRRTRSRILLSHLRLGALSVAFYDSQGYGGGILSLLHTVAIEVNLKLFWDRQSVGQSVLVPGTHPTPMTRL